jgi:hypothetical protein
MIMVSCDELKKSFIKTKNNILMEVISESEFFNDVKQTLDSLDNGFFISIEYKDDIENSIDQEQMDEEEFQDDYSNNNKDDKYSNDYIQEDENELEYNDFDDEDEEEYENEDVSDLDENEDYEEESFLENEFYEEMDMDELELIRKELEDYKMEGKSNEELKIKLIEVKNLLKKLKNKLDENDNMNNALESDANDIYNEDNEMNVEYYDENDQNSVLRLNALEKIHNYGIEELEECVIKNIKRLTVMTMFNMETEVNFNMNAVF